MRSRYEDTLLNATFMQSKIYDEKEYGANRASPDILRGICFYMETCLTSLA